MRALRRLLTASLATLLVVVAGTALVTSPAVAADPAPAFTVDDFNGSSMGTRTVVAADPFSCDLTHDNQVTFGTGTMHVVLTSPDSDGCRIGAAQIRWDAPSPENIAANGTDRIELQYSDILPNQPSAITFGVSVKDSSGRVSQVGGLSRNGGAAADFLTIRYAPAYPGDVSYLQGSADLTAIVSLTLTISTPNQSTTTSVTFQGIGFTGAEPSYEQPSIGAATAYAYLPGVTTSNTFAVTGYPEPDVTVTGLPAGLTATAVKGSHVTNVTVAGNPGTAYGVTTAHVHADVANSLTDDRDVTITVPSPVTWSAAAFAHPLVGQAYDGVLGTVTSTPAATPSMTGVPAGLSLAVVGTALHLVGTPVSAGPFTISGQLTNGYLAAPVSVSGEVWAPTTLGVVPDLSATLGTSIAPFEIAVGGYPTPAVTATGLPAGLVQSQTSTGLAISGTPTATGTFPVTVTAVGGANPATSTFTVVVGTVPTISVPATVTVGAGSPLVVPVTTTGSPAPTVAASGLPAWLTLGAGTLTGTPTRADAGVTSVTLRATNSFGTTPDATTAITVTAPAQIASFPSASGQVGSPLTFSVATTGYPAPIPAYAGILPAGTTATVSGTTLVLAGTPTQAGTFPLTVTATNGIGQPDVQQLVLVVRAAPSFADTDPLLVVPAGASLSQALAVAGYEAPTLTLAPGTTLPTWLTFTAGTFAGTPTVADAGDHGPFTVTATNTVGTATAHVTVRVTTPATFTSTSDATVAVGQPASTGVAHVGGFPLPAVSAVLPPGLTLVTAPDGTVSLAGTPSRTGTYSVNLHADNGAGSADDSLVVSVVSPPSLATFSGDVVLTQGQPASVDLGLAGYPAPSVAVTGTLPAGLVVENGQLTGTPTATGTTVLTFVADNGVAPAAQTVVTIDVVAAPRFASGTIAATFAAGVTSTLQVTAVGYPAPVLSVGVLPAWLAFDPATGTFTGSPTISDAGVAAPVTVTAHNASGDATATVTITVTRTVAALVNGGTTVVRAGAALDDALTPVTGFPAPAVTVAGLPVGLSAVVEGGTLRLRGTTTDAGTHAVTFTLDNGTGPAVDVPWTVEVDAPSTIAVDRQVSGTAGRRLSLAVTATGFPAPTVTASGLPAGVTYVAGPSGGAIVGTPATIGTWDVTLVASNGVGDAVAHVTIVATAEPLTVHLGAPSAAPGTTLTIVVDGLAPGERVDAELHSTPRALGSATADANGHAVLTATIPTDVPVGAHTVVVTASTGTSASAALTVTAAADPAGAALASTGVDARAIAGLALLAVLAGAGAVRLSLRHRRRTA